MQVIPSSISLRIVILTSLMMGVLISGGYSSTLTSYLAIRGNYVPMSNLQEVVEKKTHALCMRNSSSAYKNLFETAQKDPDLEKKWRSLVNTQACPDMTDARQLAPKLCRRGVVYFEAPDIFLVAYRQVYHECLIVQLPGRYWGLSIAFLFSRSSPYRLVIDKL